MGNLALKQKAFPPRLPVFPKSQGLGTPQVEIPLFSHRISCGLFGVHDDSIEKYQSLDKKFIKNRAATFFFRAGGDSMSPYIEENDILVVDKSLEPCNSQIIIFSLDGEMFCKRYFKTPSSLILRSDNPQYKDRILTKDSIADFLVFGVVIGLARETSLT